MNIIYFTALVVMRKRPWFGLKKYIKYQYNINGFKQYSANVIKNRCKLIYRLYIAQKKQFKHT